MKVAHLITSKIFAGIEQHVFELAQATRLEIDHIILCDKALSTSFVDVSTHAMKIGSRRSPVSIIKLAWYLTKNKINILHCHGAKASSIGRWIGRLTQAKLVITIHGHKTHQSSVKHADAIIGVNRTLLKDIPNAVFIPNWFNPSHLGQPSSRTGPVIAVGRLEKVKGFDLLIKSWVNINEELNIIGSGQEELSLKALIKSLKLSDRVSILTDYSYSSIEEIYKNASGLIVSSLREGGPRVVLEAINHEIPVIGTKVGIIPEIIPIECLAEPGDQNSLRLLLEEMIPLLPQLDVKALKISMLENFSLSSAANHTNKIYLSLK